MDFETLASIKSYIFFKSRSFSLLIGWKMFSSSYKMEPTVSILGKEGVVFSTL